MITKDESIQNHHKSLLVLISAIFLFACGNSSEDNKMNQTTFDKIQKGMTLSEVEKIMGVDTTQTFVLIDETKMGNSSLKVTHDGVQVDDFEKIARYSYITAEEPKIMTVIYSYSDKNGQKLIRVDFHSTLKIVLSKTSQGL